MYRTNEYQKPYESTVRVPNEIQNIRNPIIFNRTGRELLFLLLAFLFAGGTWALTYILLALRMEITILLMVLMAVPSLCFGFIRPLRLNLEDWLMIWWSNNVKSAPVRKLAIVNTYDCLLTEAEEKSESDKSANRKQKLKKRKQNRKKQKQGKPWTRKIRKRYGFSK